LADLQKAVAACKEDAMAKLLGLEQREAETSFRESDLASRESTLQLEHERLETIEHQINERQLALSDEEAKYIERVWKVNERLTKR
jgi:hypothetical protein